MFCRRPAGIAGFTDKQFTIIADPPTVISAKRPTVSLTVEALMRLVNGVWAAKILGHGGLFRSNGLITVAPKGERSALCVV